MKKCQKNYFTNLMKDLFRDEDYKSKDIEAVSDRIWKEKDKSHISEEENKLSRLEKINDEPHLFPHKEIYKMPQEKDKALYEKLEEAINNKEKDIIYVFESESEDKKNKIEGNEYLKLQLIKNYQK